MMLSLRIAVFSTNLIGSIVPTGTRDLANVSWNLP
jgi:hypothetical protein